MSRKDFSEIEIEKKLKELRISNFKELVNKEVYYSRRVYGIHKVISWDEEKFKYILELEGNKFECAPFMIYR